MGFQLLPSSSTADARRLLLTRGLRGFIDGFVSVLLADYLSRIGLSPFQVGAIMTATLAGSALLIIGLGWFASHWDTRSILLAACFLMLLTGVGFLTVTAFWPLMVIAFVGTLNPSSGDVSVFLPAEQAALAHAVSSQERTALFAWYNVVGSFSAALGAAASGAAELISGRFDIGMTAAERLTFAVYAGISLISGLAYLPLRTAAPPTTRAPPLAKSRRIVFKLSALFSLDSFGGGFVVQSLLIFWLYRRFGLAPKTAGAIFFASGLVGALSQFISGRLANRIGHVKTMVFTHLPSSVFLILAGIMPTAPLAVLFLLLRACLSSMDVPARQAYVMSVVPPEERGAASSFTNVPRSLASALPPLLTGAMLGASTVGWPLICAGSLKIAYDLLLLRQFQAVKPLDERGF